MKPSFLRKRSLDALNIEINRPSAGDNPAADDTYSHPFGSKGTEPENTKYGSLEKLTLTSLRYFQEMAHRHPGMKPRFAAHCARLKEAVKTAEIKIHETPKFLPPREDMRRHLDEDLKKELDEDMGMDKSASDSIALTPEQDHFWEKAFEFYGNEALGTEHEGDEDWIAARADQDLIKEFPELAQYPHWA